jgi:hypothetical protein
MRRSYPSREKLTALDTLMQQGGIRHIGCSNYSSWQVMKSLEVSDHDRRPRFAAQWIHCTLKAPRAPPLSPRLPIAGRYVKERLPEALRSQRLPDLAGIMIKGNMYSTTPKPAAPAAAKRPKEDHSLNIIASFAAKLSLITPPLLADSARQSRPASAQPMHRHLAPSLRRRS